MGMYRGSVLSPFLFAMVVDVVAEFAKEGGLSELLYADCLVLMSSENRNLFAKSLSKLTLGKPQ